MDDPWDGFAHYLEETCRLHAADRGLNDVMQAVRAAGAPDAWRRHLGFLLDGYTHQHRPQPAAAGPGRRDLG